MQVVSVVLVDGDALSVVWPHQATIVQSADNFLTLAPALRWAEDEDIFDAHATHLLRSFGGRPRVFCHVGGRS